MQELRSTCRLGVHPVNPERCNSNLVPGSPALLSLIEEQKPYVRRRPTQFVILISVALFCLTTLLMEQETAVVCGGRKHLGDRQSVLWVHVWSRLSRNIITRRGHQTSALWFTAVTVQVCLDVLKLRHRK